MNAMPLDPHDHRRSQRLDSFVRAYHAICLLFLCRVLTFACARHAIVVLPFDCCLLLMRSIEGECFGQHEIIQSVK
jgi:hypothetical protein